MLKTAPFQAGSEDWSAFVACVALTLTTIGGFALIMDDPTTRTYESAVLAVILIGINVLCIVIEILIVVVVDCGAYERCTGVNGDGIGNSVANDPRTMQPTLSLPDSAENDVTKLNPKMKKTPQKSVKVIPVESKPVDQGSESFAEQRIARARSRRSRPNMSFGTDSVSHI